MDKRIPSSSQTVGPFFTIGLEDMIERMTEQRAGADCAIEIRGRVLDGDGVPVSDALLEFWNGEDELCDDSGDRKRSGISDGFGRAVTDENGNFAAKMAKPDVTRSEDGPIQAPHLMVLVFARGLLRHLLSRVYFDDERANESDPVLLCVPAARQQTMIAMREGANAYRWNVILQGENETVFFAW